MEATSAATEVAARLDELRALHSRLEARSGRLGTLRGLTFLTALVLFGSRLFGPAPSVVWVPGAAALLTFVGLVVAHALLVTRMGEVETRLRLVERGPKRMAAETSGFPDRGDRFSPPNHAYAGDLDIFGQASLYQLLSTVETSAGEATLARFLSGPATVDEIGKRQEAARELSGMTRFREDLAVRGLETGTKGHDTEPFLAWAETETEEPRRSYVVIASILVSITLLLLALRQLPSADGIPLLRHLWAATFLAQNVLLLSQLKALRPILAPASSAETPFGHYVGLLRLIEAQPFQGERLRALQATLTGKGAISAIAELERIIGFAEVRNSGMAIFFLDTMLLWDVFCAAALARWRRRHGKQVRTWIEAIGELEALAALGTFAHEHPDFAFPEVDAGALHFSAEGLGHPLIPKVRRVDNDVDLGPAGSALLVTGSNMSGKSTLLRAIGINAVLAFAGAPVCAKRLRLALSSVRTSMRIKDSLDEGVSHFYAELQRVKDIVGAANAGERVLFLLDEVLHGTNSRERRIGATSIVVRLLERGAIGAVSSHDLGLADLEEKTHGKVRNVHFQELVDHDRMTFDYRLRSGVVTSTNALRLMKLLGIDVDLEET